jgi:nitronate monooxygenase
MILDALPAEDRPLIVAAGGLVTGSQVAAVLALGADAAALGTRLVAAPESLYNDAQRQALVAAKGNATVRSMVFDEMRGTLGWPKGM